MSTKENFKVLVSAPYMLPFLEEFIPQFEENGITAVAADVNERLEESDLLPIIGEYDGIICGDDRFTPKVFEAAGRLKVISKWGTGIDSIDQVAAAKHNIPVCNTLNAFTEPVADSTLGYILCFARNLPFLDQNIRNGEWKKINGRALNECTIGVIGVGNCGKAVLRRGKSFGGRLLGTDIKEIDPAFVKEVGLEVVDQEYLLANSDFISLNCDLNPTSQHLMDESAFEQMKHGAFVINTARGPLIKQTALVEALKSGKCAGAGMDVFEEEPVTSDNPLLEFRQVITAPHNANSSPKAWDRVHKNTIANLLRELDKHR